MKEKGKLIILGYHFNSDFQMHTTTWKTLISKLQTRCNILKRRNISLKGRTLTAGSLLASKIWYTTYVFPPLMSQADNIQRILNNWSRNGQISLPAAETIQLSKKEGGWNLVNVKSTLLARKTMVAHKLLFSDQPWARHKRQLISKHQKNYLKSKKLQEERLAFPSQRSCQDLVSRKKTSERTSQYL